MKFLYDDLFGDIASHLWAPPADVYRTPTGWLVKLDLAGVRREDVTVEASRSEIRVVGVRRDRFAEKGFRHHSLEISYSRFERIVPLPCQADCATMRIEYQDGMLLVILDTNGGEGG